MFLVCGQHVCILLLHFRESTGSDLSTKGGEHYLKTRNNYHNHTHYTVISAPKRTDDFTSIFYLTSTRLKRPSRSLTRDTRGPRGSDLPYRKTAKHHSVDARCGQSRDPRHRHNSESFGKRNLPPGVRGPELEHNRPPLKIRGRV